MRLTIIFVCIGLACCKSTALSVDERLQRVEEFKKMGDWDKMIVELDKLIKADPNNADLYFERGYAKEMDLRYKECISDFTKVIELSPNKCLTRTNRGFAYRKIGEYEKAVNDFTGELLINPNPYSYEHRGFVKYLMKDNKAAYEDISKSIELNPQNSIAYKSRSLVLFSMNRTDEACSDVKKAVDLGIKTKYPDYSKEIEELEDKCD